MRPHTFSLPPGVEEARADFVFARVARTTGEHIYDLFGKCVAHSLLYQAKRQETLTSDSLAARRYGSIRQVRLGTEGKAKGTAYVVYEDVMDVRLLSPSPLNWS